MFNDPCYLSSISTQMIPIWDNCILFTAVDSNRSRKQMVDSFQKSNRNCFPMSEGLLESGEKLKAKHSEDNFSK